MASPWKINSPQLRLLSHFGAFLVVAMWGGSFVSTRVLTDNGLGPVEIYVYRAFMAYILLLITCHKQIRANNWRDELMFAVCGLCGGSIYFIAENTAVTFTRVSDVSMITTLSPLLTTLLIGLIYKSERPGKWIYISSVIAFIGVGCIVFKDGFNANVTAERPKDAMLGNMLAMSAAFAWAVYAVVLRKVNVTYSAQFVTRKTFFYGFITSLPYWMISGEPISPIENFMHVEVILNLLFLGLICSMGAYIIWAASMNVLGAISTNNYLYIQPICTMVIAALLPSLNDPITLMGCLGAVLVIGGLWLGDYMSRRESLRKA